jgi:hypothetical protein
LYFIGQYTKKAVGHCIGTGQAVAISKYNSMILNMMGIWFIF